MTAHRLLPLLVTLATVVCCPAQEAQAAKDWFATGALPELRIELTDEATQSLRDEPRKYARATLIERGRDPIEVAIKLKGSAGSFQELHDKPGITVDVNRIAPKREFHGLTRFHLNNAVQDETYLQEFLTYEAFRMAGLAAPRITHARVRLGDRDLGLYVLKEGYDRRFLKRCFPDDWDGNLYDGGVNGEVHQELDRDVGRGPVDRADLKRLAKACDLPPGAERRAALRASLDVDEFLTFMAAEVMVCHWDGYTLNPNNYRIYFPKKSGRARFLVHGADQTFQDPEADLFGDPRGRVARKVLGEAVWKDAYRKRMRRLLPVFSPATRLMHRLDAKAARLMPLVKRTMSETFARRLARRHDELRERLLARAEYLTRAVTGDWPKSLEFPEGGLILADRPWRRQSDCSDAIFEGNDGDPKTPLRIRSGTCGHCNASWRTKLRLDRGEYELSATMTMKDVVLSDEEYNPGAGVRISGEERDWIAKGSAVDKRVAFKFEIDDDRTEVVLIVEMRAASGEVRFPKQSIKLRRL